MNLKTLNKPILIKGGFFEDLRGRLDFVNDFDLTQIKRFYFTSNKAIKKFRGWQGHKIESKWFFCVQGKFEVEIIKIDNWDKPSKNLIIKKYILDSNNPQVLFIPNGYVNGFSALVEKSKLMILSNYKLLENPNDEIRFKKNKWRNK